MRISPALMHMQDNERSFEHSLWLHMQDHERWGSKMGQQRMRKMRQQRMRKQKMRKPIINIPVEEKKA